MAEPSRWLQGELFPVERKRCTSCRELKPLDDYHRNRTTRDGLQNKCRACNIAQAKAFHAANQQHCRDRIAAWARRVNARNKQLVLEHLQAHPCVDCGEQDPVVLEFDHQHDKRFGIATLLHLHVPWAVIEKEIAKCEVRCANCHRRKTARDFGYYRALNPLSVGPEQVTTLPPGV
jgi:hypothetical protein